MMGFFASKPASGDAPVRRQDDRRLAAFALFALLLASTPAACQVIGTFFTPLPQVLGGAPNDLSFAETSSRYASPGMRVGDVVIRTDLQDGFGYNTNVVLTTNARGSAFNDAVGSVIATTDWGRDSAYFSIQADDRRYLDLAQQDFTEWYLRTGGTLDVGHDTISLDYEHLNPYQQPGALNAVTIIQPVAFRVDSAELQYTANDVGRFTLAPSFTLTNYDYDSFSAGGQFFDQTYRNRLELQPQLTTRYQVAPQQDAVLVVRDTQLLYSSGTVLAPRRNSNTASVLVGLDYPQPDSNIRFRLLAGVQSRQYSSPAYTSQLGPTVEFAVTWTPTRLTTVDLTFSRDIQDAADENIAGYFATIARLDVNHELRRNIRLNAFAEYQEDDYQSSLIDVESVAVAEAGRNQNLYTVGAGVTWLLSRHLRAGVRFAVSKRNGSVGSDTLPSALSDSTLVNLDFRL